MSQGLVYRTDTFSKDGKSVLVETEDDKVLVMVGSDVSTILGITKYVPEIPLSMAGDVHHSMLSPGKFDVENIQKYPDVFNSNDEVVVTEKLHGTQFQVGYFPNENDPNMFDGKFIVTSKGLSKKSLGLKYNEKNLVKNVYIKIFEEFIKPAVDFFEKVSADNNNSPVFVFGEVFGKGVQDLTYNTNKPDFRVFAVMLEDMNGKFFVSHEKMVKICDGIGLRTVPVFYVGPYDEEKVMSYRDGKTSLGGKNIREGIVVRKNIDRLDASNETAFMKFISPAYLLRKGNTTEFE